MAKARAEVNVQRDAARRIRRVTAVTGAALVALLLMTTLAWFAFDARREAERQRAEAEGQIEFMLTDLRARLRRVGSLEVMTAVNRQALQYYGRQAMDELEPDSLERRARVLQLMGADDIDRGNLDAALAAFREAHRTTAEQLARAPNDPARIFAHGQSEYWIGHVHQLRGSWREAARRYGLYGAAAERLIRIAPNNPDYMIEMAWGASNRGVVQRDGIGQPAAAQRSFEEAVGWFEKAIQARPRDEDSRDLANAYGDLADSFYVRSLWRQSLAARLRAHEIVERLQARDSSNVEITYRLAITERSIARLYYRIGEFGNVRPYLTKAYERALWLTNRDPRNAAWLLLGTKIECDLLQQTRARGRNVSNAQLRERIRGSAATLTAQRNPGISEISVCLDRIG